MDTRPLSCRIEVPYIRSSSIFLEALMFSPILSLAVQLSLVFLALVLPEVFHLVLPATPHLPLLPMLPPAEFHSMLLSAAYQPALPPDCSLLLPVLIVAEQHLSEIPQDIEQILRKLTNASTSKQSVAVRANIILSVHFDKKTAHATAEDLGLNRKCVYKWRDRFAKTHQSPRKLPKRSKAYDLGNAGRCPKIRCPKKIWRGNSALGQNNCLS